MRLFRSTLLVLSLVVVFLFKATGAQAGTLEALADVEGPHFVLNLHNVGATAGRLADSQLLSGLLGDAEEKEGILDWLHQLHVYSISLVGSPEGMHGAISFYGDSNHVFEAVELLVEGEDVDDETIAKLFNQPDDEALREKYSFSVRQMEDGIYEIETNAYGILYDLLGDWEFLISVHEGATEPFILIGSSPEQIEMARDALDDGDHLEIEGFEEEDNFLLVVDDDDGTLTEALIEEFGMPFEPRGPLALALSLDLPEDGVAISLRHNLFEVLLGTDDDAEATPLNASGLGFGGGNPFFSAIGTLSLTEDTALELLRVITDTDEEDMEELIDALESQGIELGSIVDAVRHFGAVLGGQGAVGDEPLPGGYVFVSGESKKMKGLAPLAKNLLEMSPFFEESKRKGWDLFYGINEEYSEDLPFPLFVGLKKGVLMMGVLDEEELETAPGIELDEQEPLFLAKLDMESLWSALLQILSPDSIQAFEDVGIASDDLAVLIDDFGLSVLASALQEIKSIQLHIDSERGADLLFETGAADRKLLRSLNKAIDSLTGDR